MRSLSKRQVIEQQQVSALARGDCAAELVRVATTVVQTKRLGRRKGRHRDGNHGVNTGLDSHAAGVVDHTGRKRIGGSTVVSRKTAAAGARGILQQHRGQIGQVVAARALTQHHIHAAG